jgi:protein SCO1/2
MGVVIAMLTALPLPASAHSLQELEQQLETRETYFQPMEKPAPDFTLQDGTGGLHSMADLRGKVLVLNFIYTHCPDACPLHAEKIAEIQKMINGTPMRTQVEFITITTDPERDTGAVLREYGAAHGLDPANWLFLTAAPGQPADSTRKLAQAYGLEFTPTPDGLEMHGVVTHVIDQDGILRARFHGLEFQPVNLVMFVNALTNHLQKPHDERQPTLWERLKTLF